MTSASPPSPKLTDCPWLWLMIFSATAMSAATVIGPKYAARMARKERMTTAHENVATAKAMGVRAADIDRTSPPVVPYSEADYLERPEFDWMFAILTMTMLVGAVGTHFWRLRFRRTATS